MDEDHEKNLFDALGNMEYGSCDDCGNHHYCPICGASRNNVKGHEKGCPVPGFMSVIRERGK